MVALAEALARGRPVVLNGFGRFEVRRYPGPRKKVGLVFRPAARFIEHQSGVGLEKNEKLSG